MKTPIQFFIAGNPKPAGSKRAFFIKKLKRAIIVDANPNSKDWKIDCKHAAQDNYKGELWDCAISLRLCFVQLRPKSHYRSGKNAAMLKDSAPKRPLGKPDCLKLSRGVEDALTGIIWKDDSLVVDMNLSKRYGEHPGCHVEIKGSE